MDAFKLIGPKWGALLFLVALLYRAAHLTAAGELPDLLLPTLALGVFFTATGWRKLFLPEVHTQVFGLFAKLRVPTPAGWAVVVGEFAGGLGLVAGVLEWWAALGLIPIMLGAYLLDTLPGIRARRPADVSAWAAECTCNAEFLLLLILATLVIYGG